MINNEVIKSIFSLTEDEVITLDKISVIVGDDQLLRLILIHLRRIDEKLYHMQNKSVGKLPEAIKD